MGNNIEIRLNQTQYFPSQIITGVIVVKNAEQELKNTSKLFIQFLGQESVRHNQKSQESKTIYSQICLLKDLNEEHQLMKTITFPFTFQLPNNISGTVKSDDYATTYYLSLVAEDANKARQQLECTQFSISEYANKKNELRSFSKTHEMQGFLQTHQGMLKMTCQIRGQEFYVGDSVTIDLDIDLRGSKQYIEDIDIYLIERTTLETEPKKSIEKIIKSQTLPGLVQGAVGKMSKSILLFNLNNEFIPSITGQLISSDYLIRVKANSVIFNLNNNCLTFDIPIKIFRRPIKNQPSPKQQSYNIPDLFHQFPVVNLE